MKKNILTHILTTIKYILTHILILLYLLYIGSYICNTNTSTMQIFFFAPPIIIGLTIFFIKKCKKEQITPRTLINQTFKTSAITLGALALLKIVIKSEYIDIFPYFIPTAILFLFSIFTKITELPSLQNNKLSSKIKLINAIYFQCIILSIYSIFIGGITKDTIIDFYTCQSITNAHPDADKLHIKDTFAE